MQLYPMPFADNIMDWLREVTRLRTEDVQEFEGMTTSTGESSGTGGIIDGGSFLDDISIIDGGYFI